MTQHDDELEKAANKHSFIHVSKLDFIAGARWHAEKSKELVAENARLLNLVRELEFNCCHTYGCEIGQKAREALSASNGNALAAIREAMEAMKSIGNYAACGANGDDCAKIGEKALAKLREVFGE